MKYVYLLGLSLTLMACGGETDEVVDEATPEVNEEQIIEIEEATEEVDAGLEELEGDVEELNTEIDSLLNGI